MAGFMNQISKESTLELRLPLSFLQRPANSAGTRPWLLVLMHGVGSNERDLFGLTAHVPPNCHVLSLRAPHVLGPGSYAWFEFGITPGGERRIDEAQELASRQLVAQTVASAAQQLDVPPERVVVGGFSQGGIMSLSLLLTQPQLLRGAMVLHSRLLPQVLPLIAPPEQLEGKQLWVSHGLQDQVIALASARDIRERVSRLPLTLSYTEYPGGHAIMAAELDAAMNWLRAMTV